MKKQKMMVLGLAAMLCLTTGSGCSAKGSQPKETSPKENKTESGQDNAAPSKEESSREKVLKIWVPDNIRIEDWEDNAMAEWLEEQGDFQLEIIPLASDDYVTKVNMALTAGSVSELPDIIMVDGNKGFTDSQVWSWAQAGTILPLTEYYEDQKLAVNINQAKERTGEDYVQQVRSPDGNIYGIATYNQSYGNEYPHKLWLYRPWLKALKKDVPNTTEEFYQLLKLVSETDLNGNGKADEIGMLGTTEGRKGYLNFLMNGFVYAGDGQYRTVSDGEVSVAYTSESWKEGLNYIKKLFSENLILRESLTISDEQFNTLINSEEPVVFSMVCLAPSMITSGSERSTEYVCVDTLTGPDGVNFASYTPTVAKISFVVTANCKEAETAFRLGDLMSSEYIGICQRWGKEGTDWDYIETIGDTSSYTASVEGFDMSIVTYNDGGFWGGTDQTKNSWRQTGPFVRQYGIANGWAMSADSLDEYTRNTNAGFSLYQNSGHAPKEVIPKLIYTQEESDEIAEIESTLTTYVNECLGNFVTGNLDIEDNWDSYLSELDKIGLPTYLETVQTVYDRMYK